MVGVKGPRGVGDGVESGNGEREGAGDVGGSGGAVPNARKRPKRAAALAAAAANSAVAANDVGTSARGIQTRAVGALNVTYTPPQVSRTPQVMQAPLEQVGASNKDWSVVGVTGGLAAIDNHLSMEILPPETGGWDFPFSAHGD